MMEITSFSRNPNDRFKSITLKAYEMVWKLEIGKKNYTHIEVNPFQGSFFPVIYSFCSLFEGY